MPVAASEAFIDFSILSQPLTGIQFYYLFFAKFEKMNSSYVNSIFSKLHPCLCRNDPSLITLGTVKLVESDKEASA